MKAVDFLEYLENKGIILKNFKLDYIIPTIEFVEGEEIVEECTIHLKRLGDKNESL